jgi:quercetin dioxygenase-like cupin family protein
VRAGDIVAYAPEEKHGMRALDEQLVLAAVIAPRPAARQP